jgi:hypothetical protein
LSSSSSSYNLGTAHTENTVSSIVTSVPVAAEMFTVPLPSNGDLYSLNYSGTELYTTTGKANPVTSHEGS